MNTICDYHDLSLKTDVLLLTYIFEEFNNTFLINFDGYILEVGLEYFDKLHELHNDYPLAPEKLEISQYCQIIVAIMQINIA